MACEIECSEFECRKRLADVKNMSYSDLEKYNTKCCKCGNWILKDNTTANKTYNAVSTRWAEEFMKNMMGKK